MFLLTLKCDVCVVNVSRKQCKVNVVKSIKTMHKHVTQLYNWYCSRQCVNKFFKKANQLVFKLFLK